jgi:hypothetical protein
MLVVDLGHEINNMKNNTNVVIKMQLGTFTDVSSSTSKPNTFSCCESRGKGHSKYDDLRLPLYRTCSFFLGYGTVYGISLSRRTTDSVANKNTRLVNDSLSVVDCPH